MAFDLKKCSLQQIHKLIQIGKETFFETFNEHNTKENMDQYLATAFTIEKMTSELNNPHSTFYLAFDEGTPIGYLKLNFEDAQTEDVGREWMEVERIYVKQSHQKLGIGRLFIEKAEVVAKENNVKGMWLGVWEINDKAIRFYEKAGFEVFDTHSFWMGDEEQKDLLMKKAF